MTKAVIGVGLFFSMFVLDVSGVGDSIALGLRLILYRTVGLVAGMFIGIGLSED